MKRTTVKLPDDLDARLRHEAARRRVTVSGLAREAIETRLELLESHPGPVVVPVLVVTEVAHPLAGRLGVEAGVRFLGGFAAGYLISEPVAGEDWLRIAELVGELSDLPLGTVDVSVVAVAERLPVTQIAASTTATSPSQVRPTLAVERQRQPGRAPYGDRWWLPLDLAVDAGVAHALGRQW